jgi:hypothetical protein
VDSIPGVAKLDNLGIPESGDGISDVLEEAKWEADYVAKLQDTDGGFYFLVYPKGPRIRVQRHARPRRPPGRLAEEHGGNRRRRRGACAVRLVARSSGGTTPRPAARYLQQARLGWRFLTAAVARYGKAGAYQKLTFYGDRYTHDDELAWAACELYLATGEAEFRQRLFEWFPNPADPATFRWGWWRMSEGWGNAIRSYAFAARSGRLPAAALDARYLALCEGQILAAGR